MRIYDLSFDIENGMPTCGTAWHQTVELSQLGKIDEVGRNTYSIVIGSHTGTHMDAPRHFIKEGKSVEKLDINMMWGKATVVDFRHIKAGEVVKLSDVKNIDVKERLIFVFGWFHNWKTPRYYSNFPYFESAAIEYLINNGMRVMALDTPSPDNGNAIANSEDVDSPNHLLLLNNNVMIVEYLNNTDMLVGGKEYELVALPLRIKGSDGSPARVLVRED